MRTLVLLLIALVGPGCATYEYNITQPDNLRGHIPQKTDRIVKIDPLEYHFRSVDNHLVIRTFNPTADPIILLGDRSTVVAPDGQSHPLRTQTIAPGSFIKIIFPPIQPKAFIQDPILGVGIGARVDAADYDLGPRYLYVDNPDELLYWDWNGETDITATFMYRRGSNEFSNHLTFHRQKM